MSGKKFESLDLESRLHRSRGRTGRTHSANVKLTRAELSELEAAAKSQQKALGECARDVLLEHARPQPSMRALFTEIVAIRSAMNTSFAHLAGGKLTDKAIAQITEELRIKKHSLAREVLEQYTITGEE